MLQLHARNGTKKNTWVPECYIPALSEAVDKLEFYQINGPSEKAFGWAEAMDFERMRSLRCA